MVKGILEMTSPFFPLSLSSLSLSSPSPLSPPLFLSPLFLSLPLPSPPLSFLPPSLSFLVLLFQQRAEIFINSLRAPILCVRCADKGEGSLQLIVSERMTVTTTTSTVLKSRSGVGVASKPLSQWLTEEFCVLFYCWTFGLSLYTWVFAGWLLYNVSWIRLPLLLYVVLFEVNMFCCWCSCMVLHHRHGQHIIHPATGTSPTSYGAHCHAHSTGHHRCASM